MVHRLQNVRDIDISIGIKIMASDDFSMTMLYSAGNACVMLGWSIRPKLPALYQTRALLKLGHY